MTATASRSGEHLTPVSAADAVSGISSGERVFIGGMAWTPDALVDAMTARAHELRDVQIVQLCPLGEVPYAVPEHAGSFRLTTPFIGPGG